MSGKSMKMLCLALAGALIVCAVPMAALAEFTVGEQSSPCEADLDGDGAAETITVMDVLHEDGDAYMGLEVRKGEARCRVETDIAVQEKLWLGDVDGDGLPEILFSGDECSDDYITYCWKYRDGQLHVIPFEEGDVLNAGLLAVSPHKVSVFATVNALGTYVGFRDLIYEDGRLALDGDVWQLATEEYTPELLVKQDIYVLAGNPGEEGDFGEEATLEEGTLIYLIDTDGSTKVDFMTASGTRGTILLDEDDWGSRTFVNGMPETDVFEGIEYAD